VKRVPPWAQPAIGGAVTGLVAAACLFGLRAPGITGGGYAELEHALSGSLAARVMLVLCVAKIVAVGRRDPQHLVRDLREGGRMIQKRLGRDRVALLFGSEKRGLSNEDLSHCHWLLRVPTREEHRSMNLGQAVAVCLYELAHERRSIPAREKAVLATAGDLERLTSVLLGALRASGYLKPKAGSENKSRAAAPAEEKIRRLIRRMSLSARDAELLLGMVRQILWKIKA